MRGETALLQGGTAPVDPQGKEVSSLTGEPRPIPRRASHGSERRRRSMLLAIRLTADELAAVNQRAEGTGLRTGSYARLILLGVRARQARRPPVEKQELARLLGALGHIGGNINQIARAANSGRPVLDGELARALADIRAMRDAVLKALGRST